MIGAVIGASAMLHVPVVEVTPQQCKAAVGLGGKCGKDMIVKVMSRLFNQPTLNNHIADAVACAISGIVVYKKNSV